MSDKEKKENQNPKAQEIDPKDLEQVTGAGNPFENVPRVNVKEIDDNLRDKI